MATHRVVLIPGDGIGPEVTAAVTRIMEAACAPIQMLTDGLFIRCAKEVHESEFPQIAYRELIIDAGCMRLVQDQARFDVLLMETSTATW